MKKSSIWASYILIVAAAVLWSIVGIFVNTLSNTGLTREQIVFLRSSSATVFLGLYLLAAGKSDLFKIRLRDLWCFIGSGSISLFFMNICYFNAMKYTSMSVAAVLMYTAPAFVTVMSAILFGEKISRIKVAAIILTFAGCALICGIFDTGAVFSPTGILLGVGSGISYALYSIFSRFALNRGYNSLAISFYTFLFASLCSLFVADFGTLAPIMKNSIGNWFLATGIGVICCVLPYLFYTEGLKNVENGHASVIATLEPLVATVVGVAFYGEKFRLTMAAGFALLVFGIIIMNNKNE